jgi:decaprenylphospho-beta-D-ribofuranose 2-oxidase
MKRKENVCNWGNYPVVEAEVSSASDSASLKQLIENSESCIARGLGRSYGDASLGKHIISTLKLNRFLSFDKAGGIIEAEAGVSLAEILEVAVPHGWFLPVTPGTKFVTLGGAIAADVHGKNHHKDGSFCDHVTYIDLMLSDGTIKRCQSGDGSSLFEASRGGMGLTGLIYKAGLKLKKIETSYIDQHIHKAKNLEHIFELFQAKQSATYSVAWIDCLAKGKNIGRSVLITGEHAELKQLKTKQQKEPLKLVPAAKLNMPFNFPSFVLNPFSIKVFNMLYYAKHKDGSSGITPYEPFFYPLDGIGNWNRMYGKRGFLQYQFVLPLEQSYDGLREVLDLVAAQGKASFLAVLKLFGKQESLMSFPFEGYTLALDFPVNNKIFAFLDKLDELIHKRGGRIYLAKDARLSAENFKKGYPSTADFNQIRDQYQSNPKYTSRQSERLKL